jgi:hypothetical protein
VEETGWARNQIIRPREAWPSINHSLLSDPAELRIKDLRLICTIENKKKYGEEYFLYHSH